MNLNIRMATAALAMIFASTAAQGFVLDPKGTGAKWRTDVVKRNNKFTACVLGAWSKCEEAAAKFSPNNGAALDCDITVDPAVAAVGSAIGVDKITALNTALDKCDKILNEPDDLVKNKGKGLNAQNPLRLMSLDQIGCQGDCDPVTDGNQACFDTDDWKANAVDETNNIRATAAIIGGSLGPLLCSALAFADETKESAKLVALTGKYTAALGGCVQKCQDDFVNKKGNGFLDDQTACLIGPTGTVPLTNVDPVFTTCVAKAHASTFGKQELSPKLCNWDTNPFKALLYELLAGQVNAATNSSYDRIDLEVSFEAGILNAAGFPGQAASLGDRGNPDQRVAFGTCASCGNGVLEDYEECDNPINSLCGSIPGTVAGACPTVDDEVLGILACRCPRP